MQIQKKKHLSKIVTLRRFTNKKSSMNEIKHTKVFKYHQIVNVVTPTKYTTIKWKGIEPF